MIEFGGEIPSMDAWLREAKQDESARNVGMYLIHNGTVRRTARALVREGKENTAPVDALLFSGDVQRAERAVQETKALPGIYYVRAWLNEGLLACGDDIMYVLIGGDIRPRVVDALQFLVGKLKTECVREEEISAASVTASE